MQWRHYQSAMVLGGGKEPTTFPFHRNEMKVTAGKGVPQSMSTGFFWHQFSSGLQEFRYHPSHR
jgi:hypothetical protein